jgi:hypothetical protein
MGISEIVGLLTAERDRLDRAIQALGAPARPRGRPARGTTVVSSGVAVGTLVPAGRRRKPRTAAQRKAHSERMKAFWAARRAKK